MTVPSSTPIPTPQARSRSGRPSVIAAGLAMVVVVWLVGMAAVGRSAESLCIDDLEDAPAYGAYSQSGQLWPPEIRCTLKPIDSAENPIMEVDHPSLAVLRLVVTVGLPIGAVVGAGLAAVSLRRR